MPDDVDQARTGPPEEPGGRRTWSTLQIVLVSLAGILVVAGVVVVGVMLLVVAAMNQYASNK